MLDDAGSPQGLFFSTTAAMSSYEEVKKEQMFLRISESKHRPHQITEKGSDRMGPRNYLSLWGAIGVEAGDPPPTRPDLSKEKTH